MTIKRLSLNGENQPAELVADLQAKFDAGALLEVGSFMGVKCYVDDTLPKGMYRVYDHAGLTFAVEGTAAPEGK